MKMRNMAGFSAAACALMIVAGPAQAQQQQRPPKPDLAKMAASMDVSEQALKACMGAKPTEEPAEGSRPPRPDAAKISACLTSGGSTVSEATVSKTLASFGPPQRSQ